MGPVAMRSENHYDAAAVQGRYGSGLAHDRRLFIQESGGVTVSLKHTPAGQSVEG